MVSGVHPGTAPRKTDTTGTRSFPAPDLKAVPRVGPDRPGHRPDTGRGMVPIPPSVTLLAALTTRDANQNGAFVASLNWPAT